MAMQRVLDIEIDPDFNIQTSYHNDFFLLKTRVTVNGENTQIRSVQEGSYEVPTLVYGKNISAKLWLITNFISPILHKFGVYHMDTFYYEQSPLFHVAFSSESSLKNFLLEMEMIKHAMQLELLSIFLKSDSSHNLLVEVHPELFLVSPNRQKTKKADLHLINAENFSTFDFGSLYQEIDRLSVDDLADVQRKLFSVKTEWYNLGLELGQRVPTLDGIDAKYGGDPRQCFRQVLMEWLRGVNPRPTWQAMVNALKSHTVAQYHLAEQIQAELPPVLSTQPLLQPLSPQSLSPQRQSSQPPSTSAQPHPKSLGPEERRYLAACERAMKEKGSLEQIAMHCVFMGMPRSGKTSLLRRLLGKRLSSYASTGVAERVVHVEIRKSTVHVSGLVWCELEDLGDEAMSLMRDVSRTSPDDTTEPFSLSFDAPVDTQPPSKRIKLAASSSANLQSSAEPKVPEEQGTKTPLEVFREALQEKWSKLKDLDEDHWTLYLTDTGGQPEFQELLPVLVCGPSLFFLVFRLDFELNSRYKVEYINSSGRSIVPYEAGLTVQETLLQSLATIASTSIVRIVDGETVDILPRVFFVGTHKDLVSDKQLLQIDNTLQDVVKRTEAYDEGMVQFASESRLILAVDNMSDDEEDVQQVRAAVERIGRRGDNYRVKTPVSWLIFNNILQNHKAPVLEYELCYKLAQLCWIDTRDEMNDALQFLHENIGVIRYYHDIEELREYVIKDLRYLFDMITDLLVATFTFNRTDPSICELFTRKGIFPLDVFEKLAKSTDFLPPAKLVALLQHLNIVALLRKKGTSCQYFIPCVLAHAEASQSKMPDTAVSCVPPLLVTFESGYCPKGLFGAVTVYLLQNKMKSKLEWGLEQDRIFRDQICLSVGPYESFQLKVLPSFLSIELCSSSEPSNRMKSLADVCSEVRRSISRAVDQVSVALHCSRKAEHSFGFFCPEQVDANQSPHPATVIFLEGKPCILKCPNTHERLELPDGYLLWFSEDCSTPDSKANILASHQSGSHPSLDKQLSKSDVVFPSTAMTGKGKVLDQQQSPNEDVMTSEDIILDLRPSIAELLMLKTRKGENVNIIEHLAPQWKQFGLYLDFDHTGSHLDLIEAEHAHEPHHVVACCRKMFKHWLKDNGVKPVSWRTVIKLLNDYNERFLVKQIEDALKLN